MENTHSNKKDLSLLFMAGIILSMLLLAGCNVPSADSDSSDDTAAVSAPVVPEAEPVVAEVVEPVVEVVEAVEVIKEPVKKQVAASYTPGVMQEYSDEKFNEAVADGQPVFLDFYAPWCHICVGNSPVIEGAVESDGEVVGLRVDYDSARALRQKYGVVSQSTYILIKDGKEVARNMGPQSASTMETFLNK